MSRSGSIHGAGCGTRLAASPAYLKTEMQSPEARDGSGTSLRPQTVALGRHVLNSHHEPLRLDVQVIDGPGHRIVSLTTDLFTDDCGQNRAAARPAKLKRILLLVILSVLLFGGTAGVGSDLAYAQPAKSAAAALTAQN
jgi:hypothetical protein